MVTHSYITDAAVTQYSTLTYMSALTTAETIIAVIIIIHGAYSRDSERSV